MKKLILILGLLCALLPSASADGSRDKLIDGLLGIGVRALQAEQERRAEAALQQEDTVTEAPQEAEPGTPQKRTWRQRGRDMLGNLVTGSVDGLGEKPLSQVLAEAAKNAMDTLINEYKEQYKQEGREYAREVGDKIVGRVLKDPKIEGTLYSLQALCWGVIAYLTLVTLIVVFCLMHLKRTNMKLLAAVEELKAIYKLQKEKKD
ncbi:MAG: hypothetical protein IJN29_12775 [Akkermansia sp.]|nr:hypothetical protein [Akkermansia sp.]